MIVSDFLTLYHVDVGGSGCAQLADPGLADACSTTGGEHHGYALLILGVLVLLMTWGAAVGESRPAGLALLVLGAAGLAIALGVDLPDVNKTGVIGQRFAEAQANPGLGFYLEFGARGWRCWPGWCGCCGDQLGPCPWPRPPPTASNKGVAQLGAKTKGCKDAGRP